MYQLGSEILRRIYHFFAAHTMIVQRSVRFILTCGTLVIRSVRKM